MKKEEKEGKGRSGVRGRMREAEVYGEGDCTSSRIQCQEMLAVRIAIGIHLNSKISPSEAITCGAPLSLFLREAVKCSMCLISFTLVNH